jgi:hypothetical protein
MELGDTRAVEDHQLMLHLGYVQFGKVLRSAPAISR